ncbi:MAG: complex I NDUFA9 subunit family protein [Betaproteobacteria bacterium]|nr:complex I NDUFA9 subunit family protein [Betaproteobacteria bacterium]
MNSSAKRVLILGGTGFVGRHVCEKLTRMGCSMTVITRRASQAAAIQNLPRVRAHVQLPQVIAQACLASGVKRLIHISALGASLDGPSNYQRSKAQGEAVLQQAGLDLTLLQPSVIFGADDKFLNLFAQLQQIAPAVPLAGASTRFQPVWVEDVASAVAHCVMDAKTQGHTYEICGPEIWTLKELVQKSGQWAGVKGGRGQWAGVKGGRGRWVFGIPHTLAWLQAFLMELAPGQPLMSRDNLRSMQVDNMASGKALSLKDLNIQASSVSSIAPNYLGYKGACTKLDVFRAKGRP